MVALGVLLGSACAPSGAPASAPSASAATRDNAQRVRDFMAALVADASEDAERDFDARMRAELPPPLLRSHWRTIVAKHGQLSSWRVGRHDHLYGKDRYTLELVFSDDTVYALIVFEPAGRIVGLFFSERRTPATAQDLEQRPGELAVAVGALGLLGTLTLAQPPQSERAPGVVLVAGSGPNDQDESVGKAKPFRDLARGLAARGVMSLRFDKRTHARPESIDKLHITVETETLLDAIAAVELLRGRSEIDPQRVYVIGHSLGALLAPEIAKRAGGVAGLVLLAAPGRSLPELMLEQLRALGGKASELQATAARVKALPHLPPTETVLGVPAGYWQDLAQRDELGIARGLGVPVLLLRGAADRQVAAIDQQIWADALSGHVPVEAVTLPNLGHLFVTDDASSEPHVPADVIARIAAFVSAHPTPARAAQPAK